MGFDDMLYDLEIEERVLAICKDIAGYYCFEDDEGVTSKDLDDWESELDYNGYSVTFHTVLPIVMTKAMGMAPRGMTEEIKNHVRMKVRQTILGSYGFKLAADPAMTTPTKEATVTEAAEELSKKPKL